MSSLPAGSRANVGRPVLSRSGDNAIIHPMQRTLPLALLLLAYLLVAGLYAVYTPPWQAPDEPAHVSYVRQLASGSLPVIEPGDYDQDYQGTVISSEFDPQYSVAPFSYEDWQPPLYYLLLTPVYLLFDGALVPLRLVSVLLGAGVVLVAYLVGRQVWPGRERLALALALTTAVFVAFLPQHVAILASVNNDSLAELLIGLILWLLLRLRTEVSGRLWLLVGVLLGLGFLTKATVYLMVPLAALVLWWRYRRDRPALLANGLRVAVPAGLLGLPWWVRNMVVYGPLDPLATAAHDAVVVGQPRTVEWLALYGPGEVAGRFLRTTFQSFWGQFGWMALPLPSWIYAPLLLFTALVLLGLLWNAFSRRSPDPARRSPVPILLTAFLLSLLLYLGYNVTFVQHQGRYLFTALIPIGVAVAAGLGALGRPVWGRWPWLALGLPAGLALALIGLDLLALFRFIIPCLSFGGSC